MAGQLPFVLASASPRRGALLAQLGIVPDLVVAPAVDERVPAGELPRTHAERLAQEKLRAARLHADVVALGPDAVVLAADTVVACGRRVLPKAETETVARACLTLLSGRRHRVLTSLALGRAQTVRLRTVETRVEFKRLSDPEIAAYLASGEWEGKAGGYAIQGRAAAFIPWISGSYSSVVGLPLAETWALLESVGYR